MLSGSRAGGTSGSDGEGSWEGDMGDLGMDHSGARNVCPSVVSSSVVRDRVEGEESRGSPEREVSVFCGCMGLKQGKTWCLMVHLQRKC